VRCEQELNSPRTKCPVSSGTAELLRVLKAPETADGARQLLKPFRYHSDLRASIADEITPLISECSRPYLYGRISCLPCTDQPT
jgi:hypothetical protein